MSRALIYLWDAKHVQLGGHLIRIETAHDQYVLELPIKMLLPTWESTPAYQMVLEGFGTNTNDDN